MKARFSKRKGIKRPGSSYGPLTNLGCRDGRMGERFKMSRGEREQISPRSNMKACFSKRKGIKRPGSSYGPLTNLGYKDGRMGEA